MVECLPEAECKQVKKRSASIRTATQLDLAWARFVTGFNINPSDEDGQRYGVKLTESNPTQLLALIETMLKERAAS